MSITSGVGPVMSYEETVGTLHGLSHLVIEQVSANKARGDEIGSLAAVVRDFTHFVGKSASSSGLRLPNLTLPEFTGTDDLDRLLEQFKNVLQASGADCRHHFTYLKQQCRKDVRAYGFCTLGARAFSKATTSSRQSRF